MHPLPTAAAGAWEPSPADLHGLGARALARLAAVQGLYELDEAEGAALLDALRTLTRIELLEDAIAEQGVASEAGPNPLLSALAREQRVFLSQWAALRLTKGA